MIIEGKIVDIQRRKIYPGRIIVEGTYIKEIIEKETGSENFIMPGLIDAHIHIESSMCTPGAFAMAAVSRGTTGVVSDPHEIANVLGTDGVKFMIEDAGKVPVKFWFGAPSCVPATSFETSGAVIDSQGVDELLKMPEIKYLAEMMNFPGVIYGDAEVNRKIESAVKMGKPVDGHSPGLTGENLRKYIFAGISTDHECTKMEEALEKISLGMKILIREGSAARNLEALKELIATHPDMVMLCSDDLHPEMLEKRHINKIAARLISEGYDLFDVLGSCTLNPAKHYGLEAGLLRPGDPADFIVVDNPREMNVLETWIDGRKVWDRGKILFDYKGAEPANKFCSTKISKGGITVRKTGTKIRVIEAFDGELQTKEIIADIPSATWVLPDLNRDILKIVVKDRYTDSAPATGFIKGFGLKRGALAGSVAHDSHNIICIGTNDDDIINAINEVVKMKGGLAVAEGNHISSLALPIAGIMSDKPVSTIAAQYEDLSRKVKEMGSLLSAPFMTLSFMALLVIPELKLSDKGLFDGRKFQFVPLFV
ncbi:MAG: adenine deaminase [Bacteroidales bacterium]|nr:adenine deaminase [Bacteroidales bacterium]